MADVWKTEYHVHSRDDVLYEDTYSEAAAHCADPDVLRIEKVTYYFNDTELVWERPE